MDVSVELWMNFELIIVNMASDEFHCGCHLIFRQFSVLVFCILNLQVIQTRKDYIFTILFFLRGTLLS